ncbi:hypothetical protein OC835_003213 [Tilletia horrida]|nr:hypothetical protein OC835_003213 [Tilletia horrida]
MVFDPDPFSRPVAPPRHSVESDSEDDDLDLPPSTSSLKPALVKPVYTGTSATQPNARPLLVVLAPTLTSGPGASSGASLAAALSPFSQLESVGSFALSEEGGAQAALSRTDPVDVLVLAPDAQAQTHPAASLLAREIVQTLQPSAITLLSTYWPPTYIVSPDLEPPPEDVEPPVRFLCHPPSLASSLQNAASPAQLQPFDVPNALTGIDGALVQQAALRGTPICALLQSFDMLRGVGGSSAQRGAEPIFPLDAARTGSPLPALLAAALSLPTADALERALRPALKEGATVQRTGDFLRSRGRRKVDADAGASVARLVDRRIGGGTGQGAQGPASALYV